MSVTSRKSLAEKLANDSKARPKSGSKPSVGTEAARRASILLKHVSDPTRLVVILILAESEQHVGTLCARLSQSQPAVSHHLALLRHGGIIAPRRQGHNNYYQLTDTGSALAKVVQNLLKQGEDEKPAVQPRGRGLATSTAAWSDEANKRRVSLIRQDIAGKLKSAEAQELDSLQHRFHAHLEQVSPLPFEMFDKLREIAEKEGIEVNF